ncbi:MAG: hypothetical protein GF355_04675 [Candidatus Eisenbacteria bacterium]|nr:hypothetical protein [Candidatus Eisenbacteria bacterium]
MHDLIIRESSESEVGQQGSRRFRLVAATGQGGGRDPGQLAELFDERHEAVKTAIVHVIAVAHEHDCKVGTCGRVPSDLPDFAALLVEHDIDSISLNPDSVFSVIEHLTGSRTSGAKSNDAQ